MGNDTPPPEGVITIDTKELVEQANTRAVEFEKSMGDDVFASRVTEADLITHLLDMRFVYEDALKANPMPSEQYHETYEGFLDRVNEAVNGDSAARAEYCRKQAEITARNADSEKATIAAGGELSKSLSERYSRAFWNWTRLAEKISPE